MRFKHTKVKIIMVNGNKGMKWVWQVWARVEEADKPWGVVITGKAVYSIASS
jgi:hypothetical protein